MEELIAKLVEERERIIAVMDEMLARVKAEERSGFEEGEAAEWKKLEARAAELDQRIAELEAERERRAKLEEVRAKVVSAAQVRVTREPLTYERGNRSASYLRDLVLAQLRGDAGAIERLRRHAAEMRVEVDRRVAEGKLDAQYRDISRTDGAGGEFVPPLWVLEDYAALARAGRVTADLIGARPLPDGTDSISVPRVTGGASVAAQADNAAVSETDMTTGSVTAPVTTIAGQQDASLQLVEQSPMGIDEVIFADLMAAYAAELDKQVVSGNGTAPNHRGLLNVSGINSVTYTDGTPTVGELYPKLADAVARIHTNRFMPAQAIVMHPRRWAWITAALDSQGRPLAVPNPSYAGFNPLAVGQGVAAQGIAGTMLGLPVYLDANIPTNLGAGTNEDIIVVFRPSDCRLWEGPLRTRVLQEVLSGTLAVRFQLYAYSAFMAGRYPAAISTVGGTGLVTPAF
jgi:HK97 family phage major capsid protein